MKMKFQITAILILTIFFTSCSTENNTVVQQMPSRNLKYLALGDSYTIGQSVCETCRFPIQLQDSIKKHDASIGIFSTQIIATTGWTTSNLKAAIATQNPTNDFDIVTLLIGVNNQYQNKPFSLFEQEFPELIDTAIQKAKGKKENLIVVSIPDYAYTPFGQGSMAISQGIYQYNAYIENYCIQNNIKFVNITDITRQGLAQPNLVATDGLHPSTLAYSKFVERILPKALSIIQP